MARRSPRLIRAVTVAPSDNSLGCGHGLQLRPIDAALADFVAHSRPLAELA
ncbi:MAG: hypothetical protein ABIQ98_01270 [Sphingomicrobium sp.]